MKIKLLVTTLAIAITTASNAFAACDPKTDPCAPAKKTDAWTKSMTAGFNLTKGNSDTLLLTVGAMGNYEDKEGNIIDLSASLNYGEDKTNKTSDEDTVTRNDVKAGARYDKLLNERWYVGIGSSVLTDEIADIDYRVTLDPSPGYFLLKDADFKLRLEAGPSYVFEKVAGETDSYLAPRIGEKFEWMISCTSKLYQKAEVLLDASESENYLVNAEAGIESAISTDLALVVGFRNVYDHLPAAGKDKNDFQTTTALKVNL